MLTIKSSDHIPEVSVVMAIYNEPIEWIRLSVDSILNQTCENFEFIIINDNPTRIENRTILNEYSSIDSRIIVLTNDENIGLTKSLNRGLKVTNGKYIARMDADDIALPERFEKQVNVLSSNNYDLSHSAYIMIDDKGQNLKECIRKQIDYSDLFLQNQIAHPSVMFNRNLLNLRENFYDDAIKCSQDYELWTFLFLKGIKFSYDSMPLILYRVSNQQISNKSQSKQWYYSRKSRTRFVDNYLKNINIDLDLKRINQTIEKVVKFYSSANEIQKSDLSRIIYLLLYTKIRHNPFAIFDVIRLKKCINNIGSGYLKYLYKATLKMVLPYLILIDENDK